MTRAVAQCSLQLLEAREDTAHTHDRVAAIARSAAMGRTSARLHCDPLKTLVRNGDIQARGLGDDCSVGTPRLHERICPKARMLFVGNGRDDESASVETAAFDNAASGTDHGSNTALHVLGAAAKQFAVANLWLEGAGHA